jgi:hypothetical protein
VTVYTSQKDLTAFLKEKCSKYIKDTLFFWWCITTIQK